MAKRKNTYRVAATRTIREFYTVEAYDEKHAAKLVEDGDAELTGTGYSEIENIQVEEI